jgi:hypothetical protein
MEQLLVNATVIIDRKNYVHKGDARTFQSKYLSKALLLLGF